MGGGRAPHQLSVGLRYGSITGAATATQLAVGSAMFQLFPLVFTASASSGYKMMGALGTAFAVAEPLEDLA